MQFQFFNLRGWASTTENYEGLAEIRGSFEEIAEVEDFIATNGLTSTGMFTTGPPGPNGKGGLYVIRVYSYSDRDRILLRLRFG